MRGQYLVQVGSGTCLGVGVDQRRLQARQGVQQIVLGRHRHLVGLEGGGVPVHDDLAFGAELMADPPHPDVARAQHSSGGSQGPFDLVHQRRIDGIHQAAVDLAGGLHQHGQDRRRDDQADRRVGPVPAGRQAGHAQEHGQRGEPVGPGVQAVRDQGGRADSPANPDAVPGHQLVSGEADTRRDRHGGQVAHRPRMGQPVNRCIGGQRRRRGDDNDDH
jgi:hypothetical protein